VAARRAELARQYRGALERLARAADARAAREEAVDWWRRLQSADLLDGRAAAGLLHALDAAGDRAGALQHARCTRR
jgi:DNA-binding SARP family transcriptional activator